MPTLAFERVKAVLLEVRDTKPEDRAACLARLCGDDEALRREVESLLAHEDASAPALGTAAPLAGLPDDSVSQSTAAAGAAGLRAETTQIGAYTLLDVIGEGGMGAVYRAQQTTPLRRLVALKLIPRGLDTERIVARFEAERQTLARMDHPHIARVLDAGASADGRPFFVMELVQGEPLTAAADRRRLTIEERLSLFLGVCQAVTHAHQRGVIHRDLKPSNILLTEVDGAIVPKVIDFGIAKAIGESEGFALNTHTGQFLGTPAYVSPEQAGLVDAPVDTRTDVYALGVVLYELLAGSRPFEAVSRAPAALQLLQAGEVTRPSLRVRRGRPAAAVESGRSDEADVRAVADARRTSPDRLGRRIAGDLDNIVLRALEREPARRYGSVEQLAADVRRHLDGLPVEARKATWSYRAGKFVRRHATAVTVAATLVVLLAAFGVYAARQSAVLEVERDRARREAATSGEVVTFLLGLFKVSDPSESRGNSITAREILDRGAGRIATDLGGNPPVQARLMSMMGEVYLSLGLYADAQKLLAQALAIQEKQIPPEPLELADTLDRLGTVAHDTRDLELSEQYSRRTLELRRQALGPEHPDVAAALINLATAERGLGRYREAEPLYREALALNRRLLGNENEAVGWSLFNLGWAVHQQGRLAEAEPLYREALDIQRRALGDPHADVANTLNSLAGIPYQQGRFEEARALWQEALDICTRVYGDRHAATARAHHNLAHAYFGLGRFDVAERLYRRAKEINLAMIGADHPNAATSVHSHGMALWRLGRLAEAERELRAALQVRERRLGASSIEAGASLSALARVALDAGRPADAESLARRAATIADSQTRRPAQSAQILESLAYVLTARRQPAEAVTIWRRAVALRETAEDSPPFATSLSVARLGYALVASGDAGGWKDLRDGAARLATELPPSHPDVIEVQKLAASANTDQLAAFPPR